MANLSSCDPDVLSEVPYSNSYPNDIINQDVQEMLYSEQTRIDDYPGNEINSDSNIIPYSQYLQESQDAGIQDTNSSAPNDLLVLSLVEQMTDHVANLDKENQTNKMVNESLTAELERYKERVAIFEQRLNEIDTLKETLSTHVKEKESLSKTLTVFKTKSKEKESKYIDKEIVLEKQNKELENIISQQIKPILYDGSAIVKEHVVIFVIDDEETLLLEEESQLKMLDKQNDPISLKQKINISLIYYSKLNKIKEDFGKRFVTQKELSAEQAFWLKHSNYNPDTSVKSHTPIRIEAPSELPRVSLVNESLKKLKYQLASFDKVVKMRTTSDAITADAWGFEHTKASFVTEIIPFLKVLKDTFNAFDKTLLDEITELSIDNDQLLKQIMSQEIVHIAVNSVDILDVKMSCVNECNKCLELETELLKKKDLIEKDVYDKLLKSYSTLEKHCSQEKDMVIRKLKDRIKSLSGKDYVENVKKDIDEIETINIELEHRKDIVDTAVSKHSATIAPGMFKLDIEPISHRLKNNMDAHEELLVYVSKTCPSLTKPCEKLVVVTPINKDKKVRFAGLVTSSSIIPKQTDSLKTKDSNKPLLTSTGVKPTTSASGSKPSGNTKKNRITQPPSSNQKNKVDEHHRKVKSSLNKMNSVSEPISNVHVKHFVRNANIDSICAIFNKCLFDANHDMCVIDYVDDVNVRSKSKSKRNKMRKVWKPTGKKDHLCSAYALGKSKKHSHKPKAEDSIQEKLYLLHMDLCEPMRIQSINGRKYVMVIIDDYSRFTWVKFLRSKDEVPEFVIKFLKMIQVRLNATVHNIRIDNGT
ncbi:retrovirus-related pol polyprotein from transposon TNT 1-94 [Tanacetum coccineum]